jgi:hypothetical protein
MKYIVEIFTPFWQETQKYFFKCFDWFFARLELWKIWQDKRTLVALSLLVLIVFANYLVAHLPENYEAYSFGYKTFRGFAVDFVDILVQVLLMTVCILIMKFKSFHTYIFFFSFLAYFFFKLVFQTFLAVDEEEAIYFLLGGIFFAFISKLFRNV